MSEPQGELYTILILGTLSEFGVRTLVEEIAPDLERHEMVDKVAP
jgi:hypothetical protein